MKKSKIIVPAVAELILSLGAAASGTVAWFAADRSVPVDLENITVINPVGALSVSCTAGENTVRTASSTNTEVISLKSGMQLRDASVQIAVDSKTSKNALTVWGATKLSGNTATEAKVISATGWSSGTNICYAATWDMTFSMAGSNDQKYDICFDLDSTFTAPDSKGDYKKEIYNAYRLAIYDDTDVLMVWSPLETDTAKLAYITKTDCTTAEYDNCAAGTDDPVLGTINPSGTSSLTVHCVMWFEGCDDACTETNLASKTAAETASSGLTFVAVESAA